MNKMTREEALALLKELYQENDALVERANALTEELLEIAEKV